MLETRQSRTSPPKYLIELTKDELQRLFQDDTREELVKEIIKMKEKIVLGALFNVGFMYSPRIYV